MNPTVHFVPANPGWFFLENDYSENGELEKFWKQPIVAWRMIHYAQEAYTGNGKIQTTVTPCTEEEGALDSVRFMSLMRPDGSVYISGDREFGSIEDLLSYIRTQLGLPAPAR